MNSKNSIVLISDDKNLSEKIASKLIFLRNNDEVLFSGYDDAVSSVKLAQAQVVLVHETNSKTKTVELISELKKDVNLCIILLVNSINADLILNAYDAGADDYALAEAENFELVIRTVHNIKHTSVKFKALRNLKLLEQLNVIDDMTGLYNYKYAKQVMENEIDDNLLDEASFMALSPDEESKTHFSIEKMASVILSSIRSQDIAALGKGAKVYILLPKTDVNGSIAVLNKIKEVYGADFRVCAGMLFPKQLLRILIMLLQRKKKILLMSGLMIPLKCQEIIKFSDKFLIKKWKKLLLLYFSDFKKLMKKNCSILKLSSILMMNSAFSI